MDRVPNEENGLDPLGTQNRGTNLIVSRAVG